MKPSYEELEEQLSRSRRICDAALAYERVWETAMMQACGEDGPKSVADKFAELQSQLTALTSQLESVVAENAARKSEVPLGAIENGRAFADRLAAYPFECQGGNLSMCSDWQELICCFEHLAEWAMHGQDETPATDAFLAEVRASAVEKCAEHLLSNDDIGVDSEYPIIRQFAAQLRQGGAV
ncbi:hypothetical protein DI17_003916 [Escherichia coli]|nr:hypothetical protein [Escherichia coli]